MRRLNLVLLASLQLCNARPRGFNVQEDLLAFPQYEVLFSETRISEKDAQSLLQSNAPPSTTHLSQPTNERRDTGHSDGDTTEKTYELMNLEDRRFLCSVPVSQPPAPENHTANELAKAQEAQELVRATANGWTLLDQLQEHCLYFMSGWWSYSFCKNQEIVQYHALPTTPQGQPPKRDMSTAAFILGAVPALPATPHDRDQRSSDTEQLPAELQVKGDTRYLVQRLEGGTTCDLTGRDRTIEVQYHCAPGLKGDRIAWIKEVTICAYLMVVNSPRLCEDVAFLPPEEQKANPVVCHLIGNDNTIPLLDQSRHKYEMTDTSEEAEPVEPELAYGEKTTGQDGLKEKEKVVTVGNIVVGGRNILSGGDQPGKPARLGMPRGYNYFGQKDVEDKASLEIIQALSKEDGGKVKVMDKAEMEEHDIDPKVVQEMREQMEKIAGEMGWRLEIVELADGENRELRGYIDGEGDDEAVGDGAAKDGQKKPDSKVKEKGSKKEDKKEPKKENAKDEAGSEEQFFEKDEL